MKTYHAWLAPLWYRPQAYPQLLLGTLRTIEECHPLYVFGHADCDRCNVGQQVVL